MPHATIDPANPVVTLITVHACTPEVQPRLTALLTEAVETIFRHVPGFVTANLHRGEDGTRVTNYAQYRDRAAFQSLGSNPAVPPFARRVGEMVEWADPHLYEVTRTTSGGEIRIEPGWNGVTLLDVHSCGAENQQELADVLAMEAETIYRHHPAFVSASTHRSFDGMRVASYLQWRSGEQFDDLHSHPLVAPTRERVRGLVTSSDGMKAYQVAGSYFPAVAAPMEGAG